MLKQIFIINGSGGVGKDTFVELVGKNIPTTQYSSIDKVKDIARQVGWDGEKDEISRKFLSDLKILTTDYNNMPFNAMIEQVCNFTNDEIYNALFLHIREPEEIAKAKICFDAITVLIKRDSIKHITSNIADKNVFNYKYDYVVDNDGTIDDLYDCSLQFVTDFFYKEIGGRED